MSLAEELVKPSSPFDCLKSPPILGIESFDVSLFHWISAALFFLAIFHTLMTSQIRSLAERMEKKLPTGQQRDLKLHILFFLSEVEIVFALWAVPLFWTIAWMYGLDTAFGYFQTREYAEPLFVFTILSLTATRPVLQIAEKSLHLSACKLGSSVAAWWMTILTLSPLLGSFITEPGAMALGALLLSKQFYAYQPSSKLAYATLALLFVNISIGGTLTNFASPAVLVLSHNWHWSSEHVFTVFGWKSILGILANNILFWWIFRKEFLSMTEKRHIAKKKELPADQELVPFWICATHLFFIGAVVWSACYPPIFLAFYLLFIGFHFATRSHQYPVRLIRPMLVGLFLAGLIIHGSLQGWWVVRVLEGLTPLAVMGAAMLLTGFNDNAAISFLATLLPNGGHLFQYAVFTGVIAGGGLTVIANAPNPAGYSILSPHFPEGIRPLKLFLAALLPTLILYGIYYLLGPIFFQAL